MSSVAFGDYSVRMREVSLLLDRAKREAEPVMSVALAKGAAVLAAAALERYVNDVVENLCKQITAKTWEQLPEGQKRYLAFQIARRLYTTSRSVFRKGDSSPKARKKLARAVREASAAFTDPSQWSYHRAYGMFMDGAAEATRVDHTLKAFDDTGRGLLDFIEGRGGDRGAVVVALKSLVDTRHSAAHALPGSTASTKDIRQWVRLSLVFARHIEAYTGHRL